ncbi:MAG TPA: hypothetical protein VN642_17130 [Dongiaceae bacterium]|nr:hypothetical protein [Dongiaceae bacterium]
MKKIICLILAMYLSGCAFPATKEGMVVTDYIAPKQTGEKIYVKESTGGSVTLPFWMSTIPNDNFTEAVKESLLNSKAFSAQSINWGDDWGLEIEILDVEHPYFGFDLTVTTNIKYSLYLRGEKVQEITIREPGTATINDTLIGIQRMRIANEYSAKANVKKFIAELSRTKPN